MANIVLKQRDGSTQEYPGSLPIAVPKPDGSLQVYTAGEAVSKTVEPDFSGGDMAVEIPEGELVTGLTVKKPDTLVPENISKGVTVAGVTGTAEGGTAESEEKTVTLDFSSGDMTIEPSAGKLLSKVGIPKPATLLPGNIKKNVTISGVTGTLESGGTPTPVQQKHAICYYDIYGNIVHSYTRAEAAALTEEPAGPELAGLEFAEWSSALSYVQSVKTFIDVMPQYKKNGFPCSILLVDIPDFSPVLNVCGSYVASIHSAVEIDWGDGEQTTTAVATDVNAQFTASHTYTSAGIKVVSMRGVTDSGYAETLYAYFGQDASEPYVPAIYSPGDSADKYYNYKLLAASQNSVRDGSSVFIGMERLKIVDAGYIENCPQLETISALSGVGTRLNKFSVIQGGVMSLKRLRGNVMSVANSVDRLYPDSMTDLHVQTTMRIPIVIPYNVNSIRTVYTKAPESSERTDKYRYGTEYIYIPDANVEAAKAYPIFEPVADYIRPLSEYPDF